MQFLNPFILFGLAAVALPVLIHFLSRRKVREVAFPSLEFLERMKTGRMRRLRLRQLFALILRTLIVAMVILAFARPAVRSLFERNARTAAVIVIDGSASMEYVNNGETLFDSAIRKAREILGAFGPGDRVAIIVAGREPVVLGNGADTGRDELLRQLGSLENTGETADVTAAFSRAFDILRDIPVPNREVYYLTDGAANALPDSLRKDKGIRLYTVLLGPPARGGGVVAALEPEERIFAPGKEMTFRVSGYAGADDDRAGVELFVDGERTGRAEAENRDGRFEARFRYTPSSSGWHSVSAVARDGRFSPGETRRLAFRVPDPREILLCGETSRDAFFIEKALAPDPGTPGASVRSVPAAGLTRDAIDDADVVVLSGVRALPTGIVRALAAAVTDRGAGLIVFPPVDGDPALYANGIFRNIYPASVAGRVRFDPKQGSAASIDWFNTAHPVLRDISARGNFRKPAVTSYLRLVPHGGVTVLARFGDGSPAAGVSVCGKGHALVFAFDVSPESGDLPFTGLFVPLLLRSVEYVSVGAVSGGSYAPGDPLREVVSGVAPGSGVFLKPEDAPTRAVNVSPVPEGVAVADESAGSPGFYSLLSGGVERMRFAVNTPDPEVRFERVDGRKLAGAFKTVRWKPLGESDNLVEAVRKDRYGKELFGWFIAGALVLLCLEMAVSRRA